MHSPPSPSRIVLWRRGKLRAQRRHQHGSDWTRRLAQKLGLIFSNDTTGEHILHVDRGPYPNARLNPAHRHRRQIDTAKGRHLPETQVRSDRPAAKVPLLALALDALVPVPAVQRHEAL